VHRFVVRRSYLMAGDLWQAGEKGKGAVANLEARMKNWVWVKKLFDSSFGR